MTKEERELLCLVADLLSRRSALGGAEYMAIRNAIKRVRNQDANPLEKDHEFG